MQIDFNPLAAVAGRIAESAAGMLAGTSGSAIAPPGQTAAPAPFSDLLIDSVAQVNHLEDQAQIAVTGLMTGAGVDVHQALIATQKASMAFELSLAVRNKAVQAYQQVMSMQF